MIYIAKLQQINCSSHIQKGFIALMSAIVISALLLAITLSLGFSGFFNRFNILDSESKERSFALAEACVDAAILESASGAYSVNKTVNVGSNTQDICKIISSQKDSPVAGHTLIKTQAIINKSYTNLKVVIDSNTFAIISFDECAISSCL